MVFVLPPSVRYLPGRSHRRQDCQTEGIERKGAAKDGRGSRGTGGQATGTRAKETRSDEETRGTRPETGGQRDPGNISQGSGSNIRDAKPLSVFRCHRPAAVDAPHHEEMETKPWRDDHRFDLRIEELQGRNEDNHLAGPPRSQKRNHRENRWGFQVFSGLKHATEKQCSIPQRRRESCVTRGLPSIVNDFTVMFGMEKMNGFLMCRRGRSSARTVLEFGLATFLLAGKNSFPLLCSSCSHWLISTKNLIVLLLLAFITNVVVVCG